MVQYFPIVTGSLTVTGSVLVSGSITTNSTITATTLVVQTITSSISAITGSTNFGSLLTNTHVFSGSVTMNPNGLFVSGSGLVGIGTTTPSQILHVYGSSIRPQIESTANGGYSTLRFVGKNSGGTSRTFEIGLNVNADDVWQVTNGTTSFLNVSASGNVGIRTNTPTFTLDVSAPVNNQGIRINSVQAAALYLYSTYNDAGNRNWGIYNNSQVFGDFDIRQSNAKDGDMTVGANSTSRFYIKNDGSVGISTNTPVGFMVAIPATGSAIAATTSQQAYDYSRFRIKHYSDSNIGLSIGYAGANYTYIQTCYNEGSTAPLLLNPFGGNITMNNGSSNATLAVNNSTGNWGISVLDPVSNGALINFKNSSAAQVGSITQNGSGTTYATTSDYRLKEDFKEINGLNKVSAIKIYDFKWKNSDNRMDGVIAHELAEVIPNAVVGEKDAVNEDGSIMPQGVDYSLIVPVLVKALQELNTKFEDYKATHP